MGTLKITLTKWNTLREALVTSVNEFIPRKMKQEDKEWIPDEIFDMMKKRQKTIPVNGTEHSTLSTEIRNRCRQDKAE